MSSKAYVWILIAICATLLCYGARDYIHVLKVPSTRGWQWLELRMMSDTASIGALIIAIALLRSATSHARSLAVFLSLLAIACTSSLDGINILGEPNSRSAIVLIIPIVSLMMLSPWFALFRFNRFTREFASYIAPDAPVTSGLDTAVPGFAAGAVIVGVVVGWLVLPAEYIFGLIVTIGGLIFAAVTWSSVAILRAAFPLANAGDRHRIAWIVEGFTLAALLLAFSVLFEALGFVGNRRIANLADSLGGFLLYAAALGLVASVAFSVFYHGALDSALILRRTALYGILALALTTLFAVIETVASNDLAAMLGVSQSLGTVAASVSVALAFGPLRKRIEVVVARLLAEDSGTSAAERST